MSPPTYSAVRTLLTRHKAKGLVTHYAVDETYVYAKSPRTEQIRDSALRQFVKTFFDGSASGAAPALLRLTRELDADEVEALQRAVQVQASALRKSPKPWRPWQCAEPPAKSRAHMDLEDALQHLDE